MSRRELLLPSGRPGGRVSVGYGAGDGRWRQAGRGTGRLDATRRDRGLREFSFSFGELQFVHNPLRNHRTWTQ